MRIFALFALASFLATPGCGGEMCTTNVAFAYEVRVTDSASGEELCGATLTARDGNFFSEYTTSCDGSYTAFGGPAERGGTYVLTASHPDYATRTVTLVVHENDCHVETAHLTIELDRSPQ